ncbi:hypothetical protein [Streptomyces sp. NPDC048643]|uniref:hypothetical protein n=1 Tax=Streptomyces sp. NPDC048643 TaxID=3155637 RepID=UPI00341720DE
MPLVSDLGGRSTGLAGRRYNDKAVARALRAAGQSGHLVGARIAVGAVPAAARM